jgi:hypothetical protein
VCVGGGGMKHSSFPNKSRQIVAFIRQELSCLETEQIIEFELSELNKTKLNLYIKLNTSKSQGRLFQSWLAYKPCVNNVKFSAYT